MPVSTALFGSVAAKVDLATLSFCGEGLVVGVTLCIVALSILFASVAIFPRTKGPDQSFIFFGGIASYSKKEFVEKMESVNRNSIEKDFLEQIHINACIARKKFLWIQRSMVCLLISIIPWAIPISFLY